MFNRYLKLLSEFLDSVPELLNSLCLHLGGCRQDPEWMLKVSRIRGKYESIDICARLLLRFREAVRGKFIGQVLGEIANAYLQGIAKLAKPQVTDHLAGECCVV